MKNQLEKEKTTREELTEEITTLLNKYNLFNSEINRMRYIYDMDPLNSISDTVYDGIVDKFEEIKKKLINTKQITEEQEDCLTYIGNVDKNLKLNKHLSKVYSLKKVKNIECIENFHNKTNKSDVVVEYKYDGMSLNLIYENGYLVDALSRGTGEVGETIKNTVFLINSIPKMLVHDKLNNIHKGTREIRGEVIITNEIFETYGKDYITARSMVVGLMRTKDCNSVKSLLQKIEFIVHGFGVGNVNNTISTYSDALVNAYKNGFNVSKYIKPTNDITEINKSINDRISAVNKLKYPIDGLVIKVNDFEQRTKLGNSKKYPNHSIAYKFQEEIKTTTKILNIEYSHGSTGRECAVGVVDEVELGVLKVNKINLYNKKYINDNKLAEGSHIEISLRNGIVPMFVRKL